MLKARVRVRPRLADNARCGRVTISYSPSCVHQSVLLVAGQALVELAPPPPHALSVVCCLTEGAAQLAVGAALLCGDGGSDITVELLCLGARHEHVGQVVIAGGATPGARTPALDAAAVRRAQSHFDEMKRAFHAIGARSPTLGHMPQAYWPLCVGVPLPAELRAGGSRWLSVPLSETLRLSQPPITKELGRALVALAREAFAGDALAGLVDAAQALVFAGAFCLDRCALHSAQFVESPHFLEETMNGDCEDGALLFLRTLLALQTHRVHWEPAIVVLTPFERARAAVRDGLHAVAVLLPPTGAARMADSVQAFAHGSRHCCSAQQNALLAAAGGASLPRATVRRRTEHVRRSAYGRVVQVVTRQGIYAVQEAPLLRHFLAAPRTYMRRGTCVAACREAAAAFALLRPPPSPLHVKPPPPGAGGGGGAAAEPAQRLPPDALVLHPPCQSAADWAAVLAFQRAVRRSGGVCNVHASCWFGRDTRRFRAVVLRAALP